MVQWSDSPSEMNTGEQGIWEERRQGVGSREACCPTGDMGRRETSLGKEDKNQGPEAGLEHITKQRLVSEAQIQSLV